MDQEKAPAPFWQDSTLKQLDAKMLVVQQKRLKEHVRKYLLRNHANIYLGNSHAHFNVKDGERFYRQMQRSLSTFEYLYCLRFLIQGLNAGKELLGWTAVVVPTMPVTAAREPARFTPLVFRSLNTLQPLHDAFKAYLEDEQAAPSKQFGMILLSAVVYGGLLDTNWLTPLLRSLQKRVRLHDGLMWVEMQRPYVYPKHAGQDEKKKYIERRWLPDPMTQALIIQLHARHQELIPKTQEFDAQLCLKAALHELYSGHNVPSLRDLYEGATCYLSLRIPAFLVNFATGKTVSATLPAKIWTRMLHDKAVRPEQDSLTDEQEELPAQQFVADSIVANMRTQEPLRKKLVGLLGEARRGRITCKPTRKKLEAFREESGPQMVPVLQMMTQWALEMLGRAEAGVAGRKGRNPLQPSSIATYLNAFDKELLACAGKDDISHYDPEELRDLYDDVVKAVKKQSQKHTASYRLTQFHRFLMRAYGAPVIDMGGMVASKGPPVLGVDANLLSPHMFRSLLYSLGWSLPQRSRLQTMRCLVVLLGYRCGLRRREALTVRLGDIMGIVTPELVIRTSYLNRLKTTDSARRLPLHLLLEPDELKALFYWRELRIAEESSGRVLEKPLFGAPGCRETVSDSLIFDEIHVMLRYIADDPKLRFHHLRHSFANRLLLILLTQESTTAKLPGQLQQFSEFHLPHRELICGLFGNMDQGRQFLYGISTLLGHADPTMTLQAYVHLLDLLLWQATSTPDVEPSLSAEAVMQITGLKRAMVFRTKAERAAAAWNMGSFTNRMARHYGNNFADPQVRCLHVVKPPEPHEDNVMLADLPDWKLVKHALSLHQAQGWSVEKIANRLQLPLESVQAWCLGSLTIKAMTTKEGKPRHLTAWQRKQEQDEREPARFPAPPDRATDLALTDKILKKVSVLPVEQMELIRTGCREFIERYSCNQGYARFTDFAGAVSFKEFLNLIGVPSEMIFVSMFAKHSPPLKHELELQQHVLQLLDMDANRLLSSGKRHVKYRHSHECSVGFMVVSTHRAIHRKNKSVAAETVYGFRYALYLLAIGLGVTEKTPAAS